MSVEPEAGRPVASCPPCGFETRVEESVRLAAPRALCVACGSEVVWRVWKGGQTLEVPQKEQGR